jgi:glycosyltransferase involved in cell wall biosynthesis/GT2 family glycosyltransferase
MIVITESLDSKMDLDRIREILDVYRKKYGLFKRFDRVFLLTQDAVDFTEYLSGIIHVPCAASRSRRMRGIISSFAYLRWLYFFLYSFLWLIKHRKMIDVLISTNVDSPTPLIFSMLYRIPYVIHYHYDMAFQVGKINKRPLIGRLLLGLERFAFKKASSIWVTSPSLINKAKAFGARRILVIPNWYALDWDEIQDEQIGTAARKSEAGSRILFVGRLHRVKQVDVLLRAFSQLQKTNPNMNMYILGDGEERRNLTSLANDLGLSKKVHFLGFVSRKVVFEMMKQSDALVLPSKMEGNPRVLIEAMMHKVPIVATNVPGIRDMVEHGKTGYLVNHPDPMELARGIEYVIKNREHAARMVNQAYAFAQQSFSEQLVSQRILNELALIAPKYGHMQARTDCSCVQPFQQDSLSLSVVIPAFNSERTLERCLASVIDAFPSNKEVIVVDDASTDDTSRIASQFPVNLLRHKSRSGSTATRNDGLRLSTGEFVAFVDSDVIATKDSFKNLLSVLAENQARGVGGVGGVALPLENSLVSDSYTVRLFGHSAIETGIRETNSIGTGFSLYSRKLLMKLGGFDENYFYGGEDYDLNLRLRKAGYKLLLVPSAKVYHDHPATLQGLAKKWFSYGFSFFEVCSTNDLKREIVLSLGWVFSCVLFLLLALWSNNLLAWLLVVLVFWTPWVLYYSRQTVKFWLHTRKAKHLVLPLIHQVVILSRTSGFLYAVLKTLLRHKSLKNDQRDAGRPPQVSHMSE